MIKKLLTNSAIYGIAPHIPKVVSVFLLPILTAYLTDVDYGIAGTIAAYTMALAALSTMGFSVVLQISFFKSRCQYKVLWREIYGFLQYWMVVFSLIQSIVLYFVIPKEAEANKWLIILLTNFNGVIFGPAGLIGPLYYQLSQHPFPVAIRSMALGFLTILINYICIVIFKWGYMGWYISSFMGTFLINASYWYFLSYHLKLSPIYNFKFRTIKRNLRVAIPTIPHYYTYFLITTSNRVVMDRSNMDLALIGKFNMAQQFTAMFESFIRAVECAIGPMCMDAIRDNDEKESKRIVYVFWLITFFSTFLFSLWSREIFSLLISNKALSDTYPYAAVLVLALNYRPMYIASSNIYFYHERTLELLYITFGAGVIALLANIVFIPKYGLWAACIINYIAFLYQGYSGFFYKTFKVKAKERYPFIKIMLLQLLMSVICLSVLDQEYIVKLCVTIAFVLLVGILFLRIVQKTSK